jgi:hypothetical protein
MVYALMPGKRISVPLDSARTVGEVKTLCAQASGVDEDMVEVYAIIGDFEYEFSNDMPVPQLPRIYLKPFIS